MNAFEQTVKNDTKAQAAKAKQVHAQQDEWPVTLAPKVYTKTPIPVPSTNPPQVIPGSSALPPEPKLTDAPANDRDVPSQVGTFDGADYRPDIGEYNLVLVKDKDVPETSEYNARGKLRFFPKGTLMGTNETFYMVTHRFADRAGINSNVRGSFVIKADSRGRPSHPLMAESGGAGGVGSMREKEKNEAKTLMDTFYNGPCMITIFFLLVLLFLQMLYYQNKLHGI
jgi:hypothetical protein